MARVLRMDKRSLTRFRTLLRCRRDELHLRLVEATASVHVSAAVVGSQIDNALATSMSGMTAAHRLQTENLLKATNGALDQIDAGTFGFCRNCGQEIGSERLEATPWTRYCITCQELISAR